MSNASAIYGLVLAGGRSSRMGYDKALIDYHGKPQREYLSSILSIVCEKVFVSCKQTEIVPAHLHPLPDQFDIESPLNGILSAFQLNNQVAWLTVPVDMPFVDESTLRYLTGHRDYKKAATCFYDSDGQEPEPLLAIWEASCYNDLLHYYKQGAVSPRGFLKQQVINLLTPPDKRVHQNINTREDLDNYQANRS
ncbi:molybdenum cofactor guanylyltransferase [Ohtaekwangia sp.]|uniref:molybdenum cofactor guanylyltransferase n=1 Tax=Ohtaekwangia sp. TaxID=2066019 RepID=UPI002FDD822F